MHSSKYAQTIVDLYTLIGADGFSTFMSDSVAAHLGDENFLERINELRELLGSTQELITFISDSVAARLGNPEFFGHIRELCKLLGADELKTFMCGGAAKRIEDPKFFERIIELHNSLARRR